MRFFSARPAAGIYCIFHVISILFQQVIACYTRGDMHVMENFEAIALSTSDRLVLESYSRMLTGLADYLGPAYELVLHSLESRYHSVIAIENGHLSGRAVGAPITDLAISMLHEIGVGSHNSDYLSYFNVSENGNPRKSTTIAIRGRHGRIIGLLCINLYLSIPFYKMIGTFTQSGSVKSEHFPSKSEDFLFTILGEALDEVEEEKDIAPGRKNKAIIYAMAEKGAFQIKNAVPLTAERLGISKNTVYLHLRHYHQKKKAARAT